MRTFSESISRVELKHREILPDLHSASTILVGSDYSGQHRRAKCEVLCFLFADLQRCDGWEVRRQAVRRRFVSDGRRLSYKDLGDKRRGRALTPFLDAANSIPGLLVSIIVDKNVASLFGEQRFRMQDPQLSGYSHWRAGVFERLLRSIHFSSFFLAGLSSPRQNVLWITDEDDIVANEQRLGEFVTLFGNISSYYLSHTLGHLRVGTTRSDTGKRDVEDFVAIADLAAGALCELFSSYEDSSALLASGLSTFTPGELLPKARSVLGWFADDTQSLKRLVYVIDEPPDAMKLRLTYLRLHGVSDVLAGSGW